MISISTVRGIIDVLGVRRWLMIINSGSLVTDLTNVETVGPRIIVVTLTIRLLSEAN